MEIAKLLEEKHIIEVRLEQLIYGSIEVGEQNSKKLIFVHYREDGFSYKR